MHDLHEADKILNIVLEYAHVNKLSKVTKIIIDLGSVVEHGEEINPEFLKANISMLGEKTLIKGAEILINKIGSDSWVLKEIIGY
jgi:Zn finger protein HypA/HybF involved in hydrogenase expression